jgi:hypothetical protein
MEASYQPHGTATFNPGTHCTRSWVCLGASQDAVVKRKILANIPQMFGF